MCTQIFDEVGILYNFLTSSTATVLVMAITILHPRGSTSIEEEKEYLRLKDLIASETPTAYYLNQFNLCNVDVLHGQSIYL